MIDDPPGGPVSSDSDIRDLVVVGGGAAGMVAAKTAVKLGASAMLIESHRTGGDCLWTGCVPSKSLLAAAHHVAAARHAASLGVHFDEPVVDFAAVMRHVRSAISTIEPIDTPEALESEGIEVRSGHAVFSTDNTVVVDGDPIRFRQAVIATGASPVLPPIPGLADHAPLTSETIWDIEDLPRRLLVIGGGSIGCELGQAFARLGSTVTIVEAAPRILMGEPEDASRIVARSLEDDGVKVVTGASVESIADSRARLSDGTVVDFDRVLVSVGRAARTSGLGLDQIGVRTNDRGQVIVSPTLRTTNPRIWAAGDVTPLPQFTHAAGSFGSIAASNAVLGLRRKAGTTVVPRVTYTDPEVASVGVSDPSSASRLTARMISHDHLDRAITEQSTEGFSRLILDHKARIIGGTVVSPRAGETIGEVTLAVRLGLRARDLAATMHPYPTYNDGIWNAAIADTREQLASPGAQRAMGALSSLRRTWLRIAR